MHDLHRPTLTSRRRATLGVAAALATVFGAGVVTTIALQRAKHPVVHVSAPAQPMVLPFAVPSLVVVQAAAPLAPPALPAAAPPPAALEEPLPVVPRALVPTVNAACVVSSEDPTCAWDAGFPAVSADGSMIAIRHIPDDGGRGYPGLSIQLVSAKSSKITASYTVLTPDEYLEPEDAGWTKLSAKMAKRAAAAQRVLDTGGFRSLVAVDVFSDLDGTTFSGAGQRLVGEANGEAIRIIDTAARTVVWQRTFPVEAVFPAAKNPSVDGEGCYPSTTRDITVAWEPTSRLLLATVSYASGPCYCGDAIAYHVTKI